MGLLDQVRGRSLDLPNGIDGYVPETAVDIFAERKWFTTADTIELPDYSRCSARRA